MVSFTGGIEDGIVLLQGPLRIVSFYRGTPRIVISSYEGQRLQLVVIGDIEDSQFLQGGGGGGGFLFFKGLKNF